MRVLLAFVLATSMSACTSEQIVMPPPPPLPWHVNAYIGFERAPDLDPLGTDEKWYYQNSLQIDGTLLKLHKQTVSCSSGSIQSLEGDGGAKFYEGQIQGTLESGTASLKYVDCDQCLPPAASSEELEVVRLPIRLLSPGVVRLGTVVYSLENRPYPDTCPGDA